MTMQATTTELSFAGAAKVADRDLDLGIVTIDETCVRMPFAAIGVAAYPVNTAVVRMPFAAGRADLRANRTLLAIG